jgi:hypothetical protein
MWEKKEKSFIFFYIHHGWYHRCSDVMSFKEESVPVMNGGKGKGGGRFI